MNDLEQSRLDLGGTEEQTNNEEYEQQEEQIDDFYDNVEDDFTLESMQNNSVIYNTDWTVETIVGQIKKQNINLSPKFQRRDAWKKKQKSLLIESLILGIPVPSILLGQIDNTVRKYDVIDGKQRLLAVVNFCLGTPRGDEENEFVSFRLSGLKYLQHLNGYTYKRMQKEDIPELSKLDNATLRASIMTNIPNVIFLYEVFSRLNSKSTQLSPQELRQSRFPGLFVDFIEKVVDDNEDVKGLLRNKNIDSRMRDNELLVRCFAFRYNTLNYQNSMSLFLDDSCDMLNKTWNKREKEYLEFYSEIANAIKFVYEKFGDEAFNLIGVERKTKSFNRTIFDIMIFFFSSSENRDKVDDDILEFLKSEIEDNTKLAESITTNTHQTLNNWYKFIVIGDLLNEMYAIDYPYQVELEKLFEEKFGKIEDQHAKEV